MTILSYQSLFQVPLPAGQLIPWRNAGEQVQQPQPPSRPALKAAAMAATGLFLVLVPPSQLIPFAGVSGQVQAHQPPHPRPERDAAIMRGDDGIAAPKINYFDFGHAVQPWQPPHPRPERSGALARGDDSGVDAPKIRFFDYGFAVQPWQPPHLKIERSGAVQRGDDGNQAVYVFNATTVFWFEFNQPQLRGQTPAQRAVGIRSKSAFAYNDPFVAWSENPAVYPRLKPERSGALARGDDGTEAVAVLTQVVVRWFESNLPQLPTMPRRATFGSAVRSGASFAIYTPFVDWSETSPAQLRIGPYARPQLLGGSVDGFAPPPTGLQTAANPWYEVPAVFPKRYSKTAEGMLLEGDDGISAIEIRFVDHGFAVQPWQPPHPKPERAAAVQHGDDSGIDAPQIRFLDYGFAVQPWQPPHLRPERDGAIARGDEGTQSVYTFQAVVINFALDGYLVNPRKNYALAGAITPHDDGTYDIRRNWFNAGWEVAPHLPRKRFIVAEGMLLEGDDGTEAPFVPPSAPITWAYDFRDATWRPKRFMPVASADAPPDNFVNWVNAGREIQPPPPPHRGQELKGGAFLRGDEGIQGRFVSWQNAGWDSLYPQALKRIVGQRTRGAVLEYIVRPPELLGSVAPPAPVIPTRNIEGYYVINQIVRIRTVENVINRRRQVP